MLKQLTLAEGDAKTVHLREPMRRLGAPELTACSKPAGELVRPGLDAGDGSLISCVLCEQVFRQIRILR